MFVSVVPHRLGKRRREMEEEEEEEERERERMLLFFGVSLSLSLSGGCEIFYKPNTSANKHRMQNNKMQNTHHKL